MVADPRYTFSCRNLSGILSFLECNLPFFLAYQDDFSAQAPVIAKKIAMDFCQMRLCDADDTQERFSETVAPGSHSFDVATAGSNESERVRVVKPQHIAVFVFTVENRSPIEFNLGQVSNSKKTHKAAPHFALNDACEQA
jgi:hypothetical protein